MKKRLFVIISAFLGFCLSVFSQGNDKIKKAYYWSGKKGFYEFLEKNIHYPVKAQLNNSQGEVVISFVVKTNGALKNVKAIRWFNKKCAANAVKGIKASPKWIPAQKDGKPIDSSYTISIFFKMVGSEFIEKAKEEQLVIWGCRAIQ